jgi:F-type H+-transporting ATPase subunit epsilon
MLLRIVTPERSLPGISADHVTFVAVDGEVGVRTGHAPLVALLKPGVVIAKTAGRISHAVAVRGGVGQILKDVVTVLADAAVLGEQVDVAKVRGQLEALRAAPIPDNASAQAIRSRDLAWLDLQTRIPAPQMTAQELAASAESASRIAAAVER